MNLVQINERLKDLRLQVVNQYANGMNPEVPPYLALGELQRRQKSQEQAAIAQGSQQGPSSSVKEQIEQKSGLMALQQMQQQQMSQQMQQPRGNMPVPSGAPQPQMQPQPQMMARGGLAGIPVRREMFEYANGGIIAFAEGGGKDYETPYDRRNRKIRESERSEEEKAEIQRRIEELMGQIPTGGTGEGPTPGRPEDSASGSELGRNITNTMSALPGASATKGVASGLRALAPALAADMRQEKKPGQQAAPSQAQQAATALEQAPQPPSWGREARPSMPPAGLAALQQRPPAARPPVTAQDGTPTQPVPVAGLPAAIKATAAQEGASQGVSPFLAEAAASAREKPVAPTPEGIIAEQNKLMPESMQEAAMKKRMADQRSRAEQEKATFEKSRPSGLDELIRVFGQAGQYKGMSGMGPAYTANQDQKRAEESAFQKRQNELLTAIEGREYEGGKELFGAREKSMTAANKSYQDRLMTNTKTLADLAGVDQRRMDEAAQRLNQMQVAKLQSATANRPSEAERIEAKYVGMIAKGQTKEAEEYLNTISKIKGGGAAGVGAGRNAIMERRQEMKEMESMAKNESGQFSEEDAKWAASRISQLARENAKESGGNGAKTMTQADVLATAKSSGKTPQQVIEAAKARGYTIQ